MTPIKLLKSLFAPPARAHPGECSRRVRDGDALLVDVREPAEWAKGVAQHAALLPMSDLSGDRRLWAPFLAAARGRALFLYCQSGTRSGMAARMLAAEGFQAVNTGSVAEWASCGWPIVPPGARIPHLPNAPVPSAGSHSPKTHRKDK